ncbi:MAG: diaminopimelate dehydrogenase [Promicromonosporaceae bacterium]|nr:diaminopimelate dehydrogenase [Promicromonosporaceae bacterium]
MAKTRIGIVGYGNLGRGVETALGQSPDQELVAVFTRRGTGVKIATPGVPVVPLAEVGEWHGQVDVLILCGGSATDLPKQGPELARHFNTVDSFDTHPEIPGYFAAVDDAALAGHHLAIVSVGWDPGLFSLIRNYASAVLPDGDTQTFWGKGVSQGHSDAIRRIPGVADAVQYTVPKAEAVAAARAGKGVGLGTRDKHDRVAYVVAEPGADRAAITQAIKTMPNYFADYDTEVHFISEAELREQHSGMPHGGFVVHAGHTSPGMGQTIEYRLDLDSNPEFTGAVLVAYARAAWRMFQNGERGARSVLDVAPSSLSPKTPAELRSQLL